MSGISKVPADFTHDDGPSLADFLPDTSSGYTAYAGAALTDSKDNALAEDVVIGALKTVKDPEIPVNIVDLGLVYNCEIKEQKGGVNILIQMTLTAPGCGMGPVIADEVKQKLLSLSGAKAVEVELVWEPQWNQDMMSDAAKLQLGLY